MQNKKAIFKAILNSIKNFYWWFPKRWLSSRGPDYSEAHSMIGEAETKTNNYKVEWEHGKHIDEGPLQWPREHV